MSTFDFFLQNKNQIRFSRFLRALIIFFAQIFRIVQDVYEKLKSGVFFVKPHFGGTPTPIFISRSRKYWKFLQNLRFQVTNLWFPLYVKSYKCMLADLLCCKLIIFQSDIIYDTLHRLVTLNKLIFSEFSILVDTGRNSYFKKTLKLNQNTYR